MKLTKQLETEVRQVYEAFWESLLNVKMKRFNSFLDENFRQIGTTEAEVFFNKKSAAKFLKATEEQVVGNIELRNRNIKIESLDKFILIIDQSDAYVKIDNEWAFYARTRSTSLLQKKEDGWKFIQQHISFPDNRTQEGETIGLEKIAKENLELRDAIKRRTVELENKNRELEIEAAVERVRAKALAMHKSEEIISVVNTLRNELGGLNIPGVGAATICLQQEKGDIRLWDITSVVELEDGFHFSMDILFRLDETDPNDWIRRIWDADEKYFVVEQDKKSIKRTLAWTRKYNPEFADNAQRFLETNDIKHVWHPVVPLSHGKLSLDLLQQPVAEVEPILTKMGATFDLAYKRFLDLKNAEAQTREAQIEASLERIRSAAIGMRKSDELMNIIHIVFGEWKKLGLDLYECNINLLDRERREWTNWGTGVGEAKLPKSYTLAWFDHPFLNQQYEDILSGFPYRLFILEGDDYHQFLHHLFTQTDFKNSPKEYKDALFGMDRLYLGHAYMKYGSVDMVGAEPLPDSTTDILKRFAKVFEQAYTRYLDLAHAEAQTREAQIELALERVRAKTMAMQHHNDLLNVTDLVAEQLIHLGFDLEIVNFSNGLSDEDWDLWITAPVSETERRTEHVIIPWIDHPYFQKTRISLDNFKKGIDLNVAVFNKKEKDSFLDHIFSNTTYKNYTDESKTYLYNKPGFTWSAVWLKDTWISICKYDTKPFTDEQAAIIRRFANAFGQAYTRFVDLQKAEAQAKEAKIEAALERVRARTMGMHQSKELLDVIETVTTQLLGLGLEFDNASFCTVNGDGSWEIWISTPQQSYPSLIHVPYLDHRIFRHINEHFARGTDFFTDIYDQDEARKFFHHFFENTIARNVSGERKQYVYNSKGFARTAILTKNIWFTTGIYDLRPFSDEENSIIRRFGKVFEQSYTRFLDLQKAEAQTREAQIEAALERIRSRSMAMHQSKELSEVASVVFEQLNKLGISIIRTWINIFNPELKCSEVWITSLFEANAYPVKVILPLDKNDLIIALHQQWKDGAEYLSYSFIGDEAVEYNKALRELTGDATLIPDSILNEFPSYYLYEGCHKYGTVGVSFFEPVSKENGEIIKRFAKVFEQTYTRFLDLQKAEAQAREAQIEAALEKVRSRSLAMHQSNELKDVIILVFEKLRELEVTMDSACILTFNKDAKGHTVWAANPDLFSVTSTYVPYFNDPIHKALYDARDNEKEFIDETWTLEEKNSMYEYLFEHTDWKYFSDDLKQTIFNFEGWGFTGTVLDNAATLLVSYSQKTYSDHEKNIIKRFGRVFEQAYIRFLDLQKAETQARESQIELGLERVRARAMAMQKSDELKELIGTVFAELTKLDLVLTRCLIMIYDPKTNDSTWWMANSEAPSDPIGLVVQYHELPPYLAYIKAWKEKDLRWQYILEGAVKKEWDDFLFVETELSHLPDFVIAGMKAPDKVYLQASFNNFGNLTLATLESLSEEHFDILLRFARVFDLTYTRFNDLKQAEAQAREAQIEAALERVRAKAMAMHKADDLNGAVAVVFEELEKLDPGVLRCGLSVLDKEKRTGNAWITSTTDHGSAVQVSGDESFDIHPLLQGAFDAWERQEDFYYLLEGEDLTNYYKAVRTVGFQLPESQFISSETGHRKQYCYVAVYHAGGLFAFRETDFPDEAKKVMKRFANVFDLTYKRFLDLQKAEASAREAKIEAGLERVRYNAMAMQTSNDVGVATAAVFHEISLLGVETMRCCITIIHHDDTADVWAATTTAEGKEMKGVGSIQLSRHSAWQGMYKAWNEKKEDFSYELKGEDLKNYYRALINMDTYSAPYLKEEDFPPDHHFYASFFEQGAVFTFSLLPHDEEKRKILRRFTNVFSLTFRRYLDLQQAEASAKEAVKQAALDRIRADIASMRTINDLNRITPLIWNELTVLGIPFVRCGVFIMDDGQRLIHTFLSTPDGKAIGAFHLPYDTPANISQILSHWLNKRKYIDHWDESAFTELANILVKQGAIASTEHYLQTVPRGGIYLHVLPFLQGMLYVGNTEQLNEEQIELIQHVADTFSTAYARYEDFNKLEAAKQQIERTLTDLKQAQQQLVQSEKMASLGELTAGIAHEIQNPLNFVNNFSEVSNELLDEMKDEMAKGNIEDAIAIAEDVKQNLDKINHHGKRADGIVKGMLHHSRTSSGQKEMTDINVLADEYLRLAYHGLRAKDKSFNAKFETEFDNSIGKINIIPQDIGRVILNLINNAFYTVTEKKRHADNGFEPTVTVTTRKENGRVEIKVQDNGNGIPQKILDKIFQPFFTTKPTGQGTGLGLSLAYDIITKGHGGELKVETKEGEGSEFIIQLSNQSS